MNPNKNVRGVVLKKAKVHMHTGCATAAKKEQKAVFNPAVLKVSVLFDL